MDKINNTRNNTRLISITKISNSRLIYYILGYYLLAYFILSFGFNSIIISGIQSLTLNYSGDLAIDHIKIEGSYFSRDKAYKYPSRMVATETITLPGDPYNHSYNLPKSFLTTDKKRIPLLPKKLQKTRISIFYKDQAEPDEIRVTIRTPTFRVLSIREDFENNWEIIKVNNPTWYNNLGYAFLLLIFILILLKLFRIDIIPLRKKSNFI